MLREEFSVKACSDPMRERPLTPGLGGRGRFRGCVDRGEESKKDTKMIEFCFVLHGGGAEDLAGN